MNEFETIFDNSWSQIESGESTLDEVLARHPEHRAQLGPLLQAASKLAGTKEITSPSPGFRARNRSQLNKYMHENPQMKRVSPVFWRLSITLVSLLLAFIVISGTVFAQSALPGDAFYDWKRSSESAWRMVSPDRLGTDLTLSNRRVQELVASSNEIGRARALEDYQRLLIRFQGANDQERVLRVLRAQQELLRDAGVSIPELDNYLIR